MAVPFRSPIDLNNLELLQALLENLGSNPGTPSGGRFIYRSDTGNFQWYDGVGAAWRVPFHAGNDGTGSGLDADLLDGVEGASYLRSDTSDSFTSGTLTMGAGTTFAAADATAVTVPTPSADSHAATKLYVDSVAQGLDIKASVRAATTANITLSAPQTIDGVSVIAGDRVLVKNQSTGSQNGIYVVAAGAWTRSTDADTSAEVNAGMFTFVEEGTTQADTGWVLTTNNPITLGTTALAFAQFSGAGSIDAGAGLTKTGNTIDVVAGNGSIVVAADSVVVGYDATVPAALTPDIAGAAGAAVVPARRDHVHNVPAAAPTTNLTATTTNAEGTGSSFARNDHTHAITANVTPTALTPDNTAAVGTNAALARADHVHGLAATAPTTTLSASTTNAEGSATSVARADHTHAITGGSGGFARIYAANVGNGTDTSITVTHSLGTKDVQVWMYDNTTPFKRQLVDVEHATTSAVTLLFGVAPTSAQYRVVVIG